VVQLAYRLQFISLQAIILVRPLSISLLRLAPSTVYYMYVNYCLYKNMAAQREIPLTELNVQQITQLSQQLDQVYLIA